MPKVSKKSISMVEKELPSRKARPVFGDVSNNAKCRPSSTARAKGASSKNTTLQTTSRRRSSRLSGAVPGDFAANVTTTSTAVARCSSSLRPCVTEAGEGKSNGGESAPITAIARTSTRRRSSQEATGREKHMTETSPSRPAGRTHNGEIDAPPRAGVPRTRASRVSRVKQSEDEQPGTSLDVKSGAQASIFKPADDKRQIANNDPPNEALLSEDTAPARKGAARNTRTSRGRTNQEKDTPAVGASQEDEAPAGKTRASKEHGKLEHHVLGRRTFTSRGRGQGDEDPLSLTASKGNATSEEAAAPIAKTIRASSKTKPSEPNDAATKPTRDKSRGIAAVMLDPPAADANEGLRRSSRTFLRATVCTSTKRSISVGKSQGKNKAGGKSTSSKRASQGEQSQQPRKSARTSRAESSARAPVRPKASCPCPDFLKEDDYRLFRGNLTGMAFDASKFTNYIAPVDLPNKGKVEEAPEYVTDIMQRLFDREVTTRPHPYMTEQPTLNTNMRSILIDWLVEVHMKFRLEASTLYLCVNIIDRYLERDIVERSRLQLVGVTSLLVACKIEEIFPPEVRDCVYICDRAYSRQEVLDMEATILRTLEYRVTAPTGYPFLVRFLHIANATKLQKFAANYYMERMLQEYTCLKHRPSLIAASCVALALNNRSIRAYEGLSGHTPGVPTDLVEYTGFDVAKILEVAEKVSLKVQNTQVTNSRRELIAVKRKYESSRYQCVALDFEDPRFEHILVAY